MHKSVCGVLEGQERAGGLGRAQEGALQWDEPCLWPALALGEPGVISEEGATCRA